MIEFKDDEVLHFVPGERAIFGLLPRYCKISCIKIEKADAIGSTVYLCEYTYGHGGTPVVTSLDEAKARIKDLEFVEVGVIEFCRS